jgi:hypothetical protein
MLTANGRNSPGIDPSTRYSGIRGAADEALLKKVLERQKNPPSTYLKKTCESAKTGSNKGHFFPHCL